MLVPVCVNHSLSWRSSRIATFLMPRSSRNVARTADALRNCSIEFEAAIDDLLLTSIENEYPIEGIYGERRRQKYQDKND